MVYIDIWEVHYFKFIKQGVCVFGSFWGTCGVGRYVLDARALVAY